MDTFSKNYWSLYLEFLHDFEKLDYKGFSLSYLCHLPSFLINNEPIWSELQDSNFSKRLKKQVNNQKEFQEAFDKFIQSHTKKAPAKDKNGKIVIHVDKLLRFPTDKLAQHFDPSKTVKLLTGGKSNGKKTKSLSSSKKIDEKNPPTTNKKNKKAKVLTNTITINAKNAKKKNAAVNNKVVDKMQIYFFDNYLSDTEKAVAQLHNQAKAIFKSNSSHHLYKDNHFQKWLLNNLSAVVKQLEMSINFLNSVSASCIVVSTTHSYKSRILSLVAAEKGIPTICMQHGIISSELGYIPKIATVDAVYGNFEKDWFKKIGAQDDSIEVIGHPRFDQVFTSPKITRDKFNKSLGLDPNKKTLMIAVRGGYDNERWRTLIQTISKKLTINIIIKNYPSKKPHTLTKKLPFVHSTKDYTIYDIFPHVDAVVAYSSTVGLEAMLANKPVFILQENIRGYTEYYSGLGDLVQTNPQQLGNLIIKFFTDPQSRDYAEKQRENFLSYAYPDSRKSFERLKALIDRLTN